MIMSFSEGVIAAALEVEAFCRQHGWPFCFIGGLAVQRWGEPRFTQDVDATLFTGLGTEALFVDAFLSVFPGRLKNARQFAIEKRVLLAQTAAGIDVDVSLGAFPFERQSIERATPWKLEQGGILTTCSAEDLIVHKVFAGRDRDWADVEGVLARQYGRLNLTRVRADLVPLLEMKEEPEALDKFERLAAHVARRSGT
jgi:hypothetical protein